MAKITKTKLERMIKIKRFKGDYVGKIIGYNPPKPRTKLYHPRGNGTFILVSEGQRTNWFNRNRKVLFSNN